MDIVLKRFAVRGMRNFPDWVELDLSKTRDYRFNEGCIKDGVIFNALILGRNASGKSNLGKALMDLRENFMVRQALNDPLFLNADSDSGHADFRFTFGYQGDEVIYEYSKSGRFELVSEKLTWAGDVVFDYDNAAGVLREANLSLVGAELLNMHYRDQAMSLATYITSNVPIDHTRVLGLIRSFAVDMYSIDVFKPAGTSTMAKALGTIIDKNKVGAFEEFLASFGIKEQLVVRTASDGNKAIHFKHATRTIPFAEACSSGTETLFKIFMNFEMDNSAPFAFFDEFDSYCHFELAEKLLRYFSQQQRTQTICTTHNTSLVKNDSMRPDCVFQIDPTRGIRSLADSTNRELRQGHNVEKLLRGGEFEW